MTPAVRRVVMVSLAVVPTGDVTVTVAIVVRCRRCHCRANALTFTASNWDDEQPVTVTAVDG